MVDRAIHDIGLPYVSDGLKGVIDAGHLATDAHLIPEGNAVHVLGGVGRDVGVLPNNLCC